MVFPPLLLAAVAAILLYAAYGLWWAVVPLVSRFGLTINNLGGLIACASVSAVVALLAGGLAALFAAIA